jgi:polyisoprenoid-binding protein YceI
MGSLTQNRSGDSVAKSLVKILTIFIFIGCSALICPARAADNPKTVDTLKSSMTVHVYKSGVFSAFGHEHEVKAPIAEGNFTEDSPSVSLRVDARQMRVMDRDVPEKDRAKIQETMLGPDVLDSEKFPAITFKSSSIERLGDGKWVVHGELTLHGETRPVKVQVEGQTGHYRGSAEVKQRDFGITPVSAGGGSVKVKNEVRVEFDIWEK